jgi:hypothetical protein
MNEPMPTPWEVTHAVDILRAAGFNILLKAGIQVSTVVETAKALSVHPKWIKSHLKEFPGAVRLPGGELRIPVDDIRTFLKRKRTS